jgi:hypothetical protein
MINFNSEGRECSALSDNTVANNETSSDYETIIYETWEKQNEESSLAFTAFCAFRDFGPERNIKKVVINIEKDTVKANRKYRTWRGWSAQYNWNKRAADFDKHLDKIRLNERRKIIEAREEAHKQVTEKMLFVINKKLDMMDPQELSQSNLTDWVKTAIQTEREVWALPLGTNHTNEDKQGQCSQLEIKFENEFKGL